MGNLIQIGLHKPGLRAMCIRVGPLSHPSPAAPRECGRCNLCCKLKGIYEIAKPMGDWCPHAVKRCGCGIYADRPLSCREYRCQWLADPLMPEEYRPDRTGFVMETHAERNRAVFTVDPAHHNVALLNIHIEECLRQGIVAFVIGRDGSCTGYTPDGVDIDEQFAIFRADDLAIKAKHGVDQ